MVVSIGPDPEHRHGHLDHLDPRLDRLRRQEQAELLPELLATRPELAEALEALALVRIRDVDTDVIAGELEERLNDLSLNELAARAGKQPGYYVHETEAANEIVAEALAPFEEDVWRAAALGLRDAARKVLLGIADALHRCCDAPDGTVLAYAGPDTPGEHARWLIHQALEAGIELDPDEVEARCPDWTLLPNGLRRTWGSEAG